MAKTKKQRKTKKVEGKAEDVKNSDVKNEKKQDDAEKSDDSLDTTAVFFDPEKIEIDLDQNDDGFDDDMIPGMPYDEGEDDYS